MKQTQKWQLERIGFQAPDPSIGSRIFEHDAFSTELNATTTLHCAAAHWSSTVLAVAVTVAPSSHPVHVHHPAAH
jgi:hypothetical protein